MGSFRYTPPREADTRHRAAKASAARQTSPRESPTPPPDSETVFIPKTKLRNIVPVLTLDETQYIHFQRRVYKIPPVGFKFGQKLLDLHINTVSLMKEIAKTGNAQKTKEYYKNLGEMVKLMWPQMHPTPRWRRVLRRFGLLRNPLRHASEQDLLKLSDFFLKCRTRSSVHSMSDLEELGLSPTQMS